MGATSSITNNPLNNIYISYDSSNKENIYIKKLIEELEKINFNVQKTDNNILINQSLDYSDKIEMINNVINNSLYVLVCITNNSVKSFIQSIEINSVLESNRKIIYIMTNKNYTPLTNKSLYSIIQNNKWYSLYDNQTFDETLKNIKDNIFN
jgi:hypothetical protein